MPVPDEAIEFIPNERFRAIVRQAVGSDPETIKQNLVTWNGDRIVVWLWAGVDTTYLPDRTVASLARSRVSPSEKITRESVEEFPGPGGAWASKHTFTVN